MELKKGYKKTKIGVIPEDWKIGLLDEYSLRGSGHTPNKQFKDYYNGEIVWVSLADSNKLDNGLISSSKIKISKKGIANSSAVLHPKGIVLMSRDAGIGKSAVAGCDLCVSQHFITWQCKKDILNNWFLYYWLQFKKKEFERIAIGSTIKTIGLPYFKQYKIPAPNIDEQKKIATVLSDTDALIASIEKLIVKKRLVKQGAMQVLLTPKEGWEVKTLGDFLDYEQPTNYLVTNTEYIETSNIPVLTAGKTFILGYTDEEFGIFTNLPVIIFDDFTTANKFVTFPFKAKSSAMKMLIPRNDKVNLRFIFEIMQRIKYPLGDHKRHWIGEYQNIEIFVPESKEQTRIAAILSDMDNEIEALETKLTKYKQIKQGMMQNLLTGKIRLV